MSRDFAGFRRPGPEAAGCWVLVRRPGRSRPSHCGHPARHGCRTCRYHAGLEAHEVAPRETQPEERRGARPAEPDRRMAAAALLAHAERMLEEADGFPAATGAELRECAAAFRRVAAWLEPAT